MNIGLTGEFSTKVTKENTAAAVLSGTLEVFSTPMMIAAMEAASVDAIKEYLEPENSSVGTKINIEHISATPVGMEVCAKSTLCEIDGRRLVFSVEAYDEAGIIGKGTHERFIINSEKFMTKTNAKSGE